MSFDVAVERRLGDVTVAASLAGDGLIALCGPSGAGKTSVLNMVAGLLAPTRGHVAVAGETLFDHRAGIDVPPERRRAGYVFQDARLFPHRRVRGNLLYARRGWRRDARTAGLISLDEAVALLGLEALLDRWPRTLSGGEARRVAIGRALLADPAFLLLDEPLASLDQPRREELMAMILRIRDVGTLPILYVSHDRDEVARLATQVVEMGR